MVTGAGTMASMIFGRRIGEFVGAGYASIISGVLFIFLGVVAFSQKNEVIYCKKIVEWISSINFVKEFLIFKKVSNVIRDPVLADDDESGHIDLFESIILSVTLVFNNIANGVAAGMAGLDVFITTLFVILLSVVAIWMGVGAGVQFRAFWFSKNAAKISGVILVCMGLFEIFS
ncbi:hypothetical protein CWS72_13380 [Telmatospirillum siberiense]|uniref:Sporulation membrane protein YtaF n=2 Tax=Telmatospirillum siberiense TaxID=382514 RepID=A0A2N3PUK7_9PROT|nr:hypothetical protein CWS72_13380 [Telmatospirillum siberiense]